MRVLLSPQIASRRTRVVRRAGQQPQPSRLRRAAEEGAKLPIIASPWVHDEVRAPRSRSPCSGLQAESCCTTVTIAERKPRRSAPRARRSQGRGGHCSQQRPQTTRSAPMARKATLIPAAPREVRPIGDCRVRNHYARSITATHSAPKTTASQKPTRANNARSERIHSRSSDLKDDR